MEGFKRKDATAEHLGRCDRCGIKDVLLHSLRTDPEKGYCSKCHDYLMKQVGKCSICQKTGVILIKKMCQKCYGKKWQKDHQKPRKPRKKHPMSSGMRRRIAKYKQLTEAEKIAAEFGM